MGWSGVKRRLIAGFAVAGCLGLASIAQAQLFRPFSDHRTALLEGNWQSCRESDGTYAERVYDGRWAGLPPFELHMGPYHEFALYRGVQDEHRDHQSSENLLKPHFPPPGPGVGGFNCFPSLFLSFSPGPGGGLGFFFFVLRPPSPSLFFFYNAAGPDFPFFFFLGGGG